MRAVARRLLGCDHLADDAAQEALLALWREPTPPTNPRAWLLTAVVLRSRQLRRSLRRRRRHEHVASHHCALHQGCDNPLHVAIAHETGERLHAAIDTLPAPQRQAFELYERTGLDYAGVAARLSLPIGTVRSRLHRARAAIEAALK
ncbi:MAG: sigma-70 family RNA polymerase sigma factor [Planctomycetes bacterium]|nr:sigma-70 family RNA polymerase sigma factor [Planctomycetota bacterium]